MIKIVQHFGLCIGLTAGGLGTASTHAFAGWAGGGGEIIKNINNPWFLQNTTVVKYCVKQGKNFSVSPSRTMELTETALRAWKLQLAKVAETADPAFGQAKVLVGTQNFQYSDCDGSEDITFQFGELSSEQKNYLGQFRRYVGAAIRTDYDEVNLKGRGFVFLASDQGEERYVGTSAPGFWSREDGLPVYRVLVHELGHVFGVPHMDSFYGFFGLGITDIMEADAPEKIAAGSTGVWPIDVNYDLASQLRVIPANSNPPGLCKPIGTESWPLHRFLEVPTQFHCIKFEKRDGSYKVLVAEGADNPSYQEHATIQIGETSKSEYKTVVSVKLTSAQKVFNIHDSMLRLYRYLPGPGFVKSSFSGTLMINGTKTTKPVAITEGFGQDFSLSGMLDGILYPDLFSLDK